MNTLDFEQQEFFEYYKIKFSKDIVLLEKCIYELQNIETFSEASGVIFRLFHNLKANSQYIGLNNMVTLLHKAECVISSIRDDNIPPGKIIIRWLVMVKEQMIKWESMLEQNILPKTDYDKSLLNDIVFGQKNNNSSVSFEQLKIVYMDKNINRAKKIIAVLSKKIEKVIHVNNITELSDVLDKDDFHVCMLNDEDNNLKAASFCSKEYPSTVVITVFDNINCQNELQFRKNGLNYFLTNPMKGEALKRILLNIIEEYFVRYNYLIKDNDINSFVSTLSMIPSSIKDVLEICENDEKGIKDLIKVITVDPVLSAYILESSHKYKLLSSELSLNMTISHLGKQSIKALTLKHLSLSLEDISLHPYGIDSEEFSKISFLRKKLMIYWYSKVSVSSLNILATTSLMGNIGQFLISKTLINKGMSEYFTNNIKESGVLMSEEHFLHTSTALISANIFKHWGLNKKIIDSVRYSDYPERAPIEIYDLCLANHIVFQLVKLDGTVETKIPEHIKSLLEDNDLDTIPLENALSRIQP